MKPLIVHTYFGVLLLLVFKKADGQLLLPIQNHVDRQEILLSLGLEPEFVTTVSYRYKLVEQTNKAYSLGTSLKIAPLTFKNRPYKIGIYSQANFIVNNKTTILVLPQIYFAHVSDKAASVNGIGFDIQTTLVRKGGKWNKGLILGWQHTVFTQLQLSKDALQSFSDRYTLPEEEKKDNFWYYTHSNRFRIAFAAAHAFDHINSIQFTAGTLFSLQKQGIMLGFSHAQAPLFVEGTFRYSLKK